MSITRLLAPIPQGDGPKRTHVRMRMSLSRIARRVATAALVAGKEDLLLEVYVAGICHAAELTERKS